LLDYREPIIIITDHENNTFNGLKASDRVLSACWLLLLEEYGVTLEYLPGKENVGTVADALLHLDIDSLKIQEETEEVLTLISGLDNILLCVCVCLSFDYAGIFSSELPFESCTTITNFNKFDCFFCLFGVTIFYPCKSLRQHFLISST
jgi:hypothetical protein